MSAPASWVQGMPMSVKSSSKLTRRKRDSQERPPMRRTVNTKTTTDAGFRASRDSMDSVGICNSLMRRLSRCLLCTHPSSAGLRVAVVFRCASVVVAVHRPYNSERPSSSPLPCHSSLLLPADTGGAQKKGCVSVPERWRLLPLPPPAALPAGAWCEALPPCAHFDRRHAAPLPLASRIPRKKR